MTKPSKQPSMQEINERFGTFIWAMANRYHTGMWTPQDVYQQLLLMIYSAMCDGMLSIDECDGAVNRVKSFAITRAINLVRNELKRQGEEMVEPPASRQPELIKFEIELIRELLFTRLDYQTATFIFELAFPSEKTIEIAMGEQKKAKKDKDLRMNIHNLKITTKHVAKSLKEKLGRVIPPVTVSRIRKRAKDKLYEQGTKQLKQ